MSDKFSEQKDMLLSIKHEISLLHQQVDYLLRNEKELGLLDLDVMMNRTHTIYDQMCSINIGNELETDFNEEEIFDALRHCQEPEDALRHCEEGTTEAIQPDPNNDEEEEPVPVEEETVEEEEPIEEELMPAEEEEPVENEDAYFEEEVEEEEPEDALRHCEEPKDDFGFILNFEPTMEETPPVFTPGDEIEMSIPHLDLPEEEPETLGDKLQQEEDHSLAAKLQHGSLSDLRSAIGINDKFLLVNELFGGSMEKYNKSIDNLNDLKTLNGALVYMNELRIELQWNSSNEAYKKLLDLVHRKFE
jgi:hypothetical protein